MDNPDDDDFIDQFEEEDPQTRSERFVQWSVMFEGSFVFLALLLAWLMDVTIWQSPSLDSIEAMNLLKAFALGVALTLPMIIALVWISNAELNYFQSAEDYLNEYIAPLLAHASFWELGVVALAAGVGEEALFRGFLQTWLQEVINPEQGALLAILMSSFIFALVHYATLEYAIFAGLMSCYLGLIYWWTGDLILPILIHFLYDWFALVHFKNQYWKKQAQTEMD